MTVLTANPGNTIGMAPALIVTKDEIDQGVSLMDEALTVADQYPE